MAVVAFANWPYIFKVTETFEIKVVDCETDQFDSLKWHDMTTDKSVEWIITVSTNSELSFVIGNNDLGNVCEPILTLEQQNENGVYEPFTGT